MSADEQVKTTFINLAPDPQALFNRYAGDVKLYAKRLAEAEFESARDANGLLAGLAIALESCIGYYKDEDTRVAVVNPIMVLELNEIVRKMLAHIADRVKERDTQRMECEHKHASIHEQRICGDCGEVVDL